MQTNSSASARSRPLRVLLLEDRAVDAELIIDELRRAGFDPQWDRVDTEAEFMALIDPRFDVILADYVLPQFDGLTALRLLQKRQLDVPFILISGSLGDERAVQCIKAGVTDYLLKDRLERLGLAVSNALEERRLRAETKLVEEQLRHSQKMESIGQLAGGIAHDFNNILTVINGRACLLLDAPELPADVRNSLTEIYTAGERAASLTRQLLLFSRKRAMRPVMLDLNDVVDDVGQMLRRLIGEHIELETDLASELSAIEGDAGMIEQVLFNLAVNARDAMPSGGRLTIATRCAEFDAAQLAGHADAVPGAYACIRVTDTGTGIAPELMPRLFEPFFTTKPVGQGTGLGLATIFGIVKQHQGWIDVSSRVGVGTTFDVCFPVARATFVPPVLVPNSEPAPAGGTETILLVEDEASVREFAVAVLQQAGYRVLQARSGRDALEIWQWHARRIELLLTDVVMPDELSGFDLAAQLLADKPSLAVIFASGYTKEASAAPEAGEHGRFIHKPYHPRALARIVREMLDARSVAPAL